VVAPTIILEIAGGNPTALVRGKSNNKTAKKLLNEVEQVGFISLEPIPKLEMMGGELCINATLAFASLLEKNGKLSISGINKLVEYENKNKLTTISIPLNYKIKDNIILLDGIGFIISKNKNKISKNLLKNLTKKYNLQAFGIIIYEKNKIDPFVYVKEINSFVNESACGSGSIAFSLFSGFNKIIQPTGEILNINIKKDKVFVSAKVKRRKK